MAILGDDADTRRRDHAGRGVRELDIAHEIAAGREWRQAGQRQTKLGLPIAFDAGDADDLAGRHDQGEVLDPLDAEIVQNLDTVEHEGGGRHGDAALRPHDAALAAALHLQLDLLADDGGRQLLPSDVTAGGLQGHAAAAQHRDAIGNAGDLGELVGHQQDRLAGGRHAFDQVEQGLDLARRQHGRRLVEHDDLGLAGETFQDLDLLAFADRQGRDQGIERHVDAEALGGLAEAIPFTGAVEAAPAVAQAKVLQHRQLADQAEMLVNHGDAARERVGGSARAVGVPAEQESAAIGPIEAEDQVAQRRLAGAVLAQQAVDLAGAKFEVDVGKRCERSEALADTACRQAWRRRHLLLTAAEAVAELCVSHPG